jgi:diguanylate cyclase (GGDEF)-like protein/PAS domain S-box-containing protein
MKYKFPFQELVEKTNDLVIITEAKNIDKPDGPKIIYVNQAFVDLSGYTREEAIGQTPRILQGPDTDPSTLKKIRCAMMNEKMVRVELLNYSKDGTPYWLDFAITPLYDKNKNLQFFAAIERDITKNKTLQNNLYQLASTDALTGVWNRRRFFESAYEEHARMQREKNPYAILMIDLDDFKNTNDTAGHLEGDKILCDVARACQSVCRKTDYICRYGGDEFLLLLHNTTKSSLHIKVNEMYKAIEAINNQNAGISIGGTHATLSDVSLDVIIARADKALYQAKDEGKNKACII